MLQRRLCNTGRELDLDSIHPVIFTRLLLLKSLIFSSLMYPRLKVCFFTSPRQREFAYVLTGLGADKDSLQRMSLGTIFLDTAVKWTSDSNGCVLKLLLMKKY